jgi:hypothetical protein
MALPFTASDADVTPYLQQLNTFQYLTSTTSTPGAKNLGKILTVVQKDIKETRRQIAEKVTVLSARQLVVTKLINSLEVNKYKNDNYVDRYTQYLTHLRSLTKKSSFMNITKGSIDITLGAELKELTLLKRELQELSLLTQSFTQQIDYLKDFDKELTKLQDKINSL